MKKALILSMLSMFYCSTSAFSADLPTNLAMLDKSGYKSAKQPDAIRDRAEHKIFYLQNSDMRFSQAGFFIDTGSPFTAKKDMSGTIYVYSRTFRASDLPSLYSLMNKVCSYNKEQLLHADKALLARSGKTMRWSPGDNLYLGLFVTTTLPTSADFSDRYKTDVTCGALFTLRIKLL